MPDTNFDFMSGLSPQLQSLLGSGLTTTGNADLAKYADASRGDPTQWLGPDLKGTGFWAGLAKALPLLALPLAPALAPLIAGSLGISTAAATGLISGGAGAISGGSQGGLEGALLGGLGGGLGAWGGSALGNALGGLGGAGASGAASAAGSAAGSALSAGGSAAGSAAASSALGPLIQELIVQGVAPSLTGALGSAIGGAGGSLLGYTGGSDPRPHLPSNYDPNATSVDFSTPLPGGIPNTGLPPPGPLNLTPPNLGPSGALDFTHPILPSGGGLGGGAGGGNTLEPITVTGNPSGAPVVPAPILSLDNGVLNHPPQGPQQQPGDHNKPDDFIKQLIEAMKPSLHPPLPIFGGNPSSTGGGHPPGTPQPQKPATNPNPAGGDNHPQVGPAPTGGTGGLGGGAGGGLGNNIGNPAGRTGVGVSGAGPLDIKGSLAPDIYPWTTPQGGL